MKRGFGMDEGTWQQVRESHVGVQAPHESLGLRPPDSGLARPGTRRALWLRTTVRALGVRDVTPHAPLRSRGPAAERSLTSGDSVTGMLPRHPLKIQGYRARIHCLVRLGEAGGTGPGHTSLASLVLGGCDSLQHAKRPPLAGGSSGRTPTSGEAPTSKGSPVRLQPSKQLVIGRMGANPKPDDFIGTPHPHGTIPSTHPYRINRLGGMHMLPAETRMRRVLPEERVCLPCLLLYLRRQLRERGAKRLRNMGDHSCSGSSTCVLPARCSASA